MAVSAALLAPGAVAGAEGVGSAVLIGGELETMPALFDQVRPCIASDPSGARISLAVWEDSRSGGADVFAARLDSAGTLLDPVCFPLATGSAVQGSPTVAFGGGHFLVAWAAQAPDLWQIRAARVAIDGTLLDDPALELASQTTVLSSPDVAYDGSDFMVVWSDARRGRARIYGTRVTDEGDVVSPGGELLASSSGELGEPALVYGDSEYLLVWTAGFREIDESDTTWTSDIAGVRLDAHSGPVAETITIAGTASEELSPAVGFDGERFLVVWAHRRDAGTQFVFAREVSIAGEVSADSLSLGRLIGGQERGFRDWPGLSFDGENFLVTWSLTVSLTGLTGVTVHFGEGAPTVSSPLLLVDAATFGQEPAWDGGQYVLVFSRQGSIDRDVGSTFVSAEEQVTGPEQILSYATPAQVPAAVAFDGTNYFVVWEEQCGSGWRVRGGRISASGELLDPAGIDLIAAPCTVPRRPALARGSDAYLLLWSQQAAVRSTIQAQLRGFDGDSLSPVLQLYAEGTPGRAPAVAWSGMRFSAAWLGSGTQTGLIGVDLQAFGDSLEMIGTPQPLQEGSGLTDAALRYADGSLFAAWGERFGGLRGYWRDAGGVAYTALIAQATAPSAPRIAYDGAWYHLIWEDDGGSVYTIRANPTGGAYDPGRQRLTDLAREGERAAIVYDGLTTIGIWQESVDGIWQLTGARFAANATVPASGRFTIADEYPTQRQPLTVAGAEGEALFVYAALVLDNGISSLRLAARTWAQIPPQLTLAVHQNPAVTSDIGIYILPSELLDSRSVYAYANGAPLDLELTDTERGVYRGAFRALATGVVTIIAGGTDALGNPGSATRSFAVGIASPDTGAVFTGPDELLTLSCPPGAVRQVTCLLMLPDEPWADTGLHATDQSWQFTLSPADLELARSLQIGFRVPGAAAWPAERSLWIERQTTAGWEVVPSQWSPSAGQLSASVDRLGQFRIRWAEGALPVARPLALLLGPDPFRQELGIRYILPRAGRLGLAIFDPTGRRLRVLAEGIAEAGMHSLRWDGRDAAGRPLGSGVYFARLRLDDQSVTRRCLLVR